MTMLPAYGKSFHDLGKMGQHKSPVSDFTKVHWGGKTRTDADEGQNRYIQNGVENPDLVAVPTSPYVFIQDVHDKYMNIEPGQ